LNIADNATINGTARIYGAITADTGLNGPVGAATQAAGKFTSLSASGDLSIADNATINGTARIYGAITADTGLDGPVGATTPNSGKFTSLSASGDLSIADNATVNLTTTLHGLVTANAGVKSTSLSASTDLIVQARTQLKSILNVSGAATFASTAVVTGELTASSNVKVGGTATFSGSTIRFYGLADDTNFAQATDSLFYYDLTTKQMKRQTNVQYLTAIAGTGIGVADGKLTTDAATGVIRWGNVAVTLQEGFNVATASFSQARTWTLPASPAISDVVRVKKDDSAYGLTIAGAGSQMIDGQASLLLESPSGSVSLVYIAHNRWSIY